jgi:hypothetical protein
VYAQRPTVTGLIPRAVKPIELDGNLEEWEGAFATPVHIGHPDFANRGAEFLSLWDEQNLYLGLRCLDQKPAHVAPDNRLYDGDAVEFYLDMRRGEQLGAKDFGPGALHLFWTPFTGTEVKPRLRVRDLPHQRGFQLTGAAVAGRKTPWGWTAEFRLPWALFPGFRPQAGEDIGLECELCSSDGGPRVDRTFVYASPRAVATPSAFGRVRLVDRVNVADLKPLGRVLLPLSVTKSANYDWLYAVAGLSSTIAKAAVKVEGRVLDGTNKARKTTTGTRTTVEGMGLVLWRGAWELFDLPPGPYKLELTAFDADNKVITARSVPFLHGDAPAARAEQNPSPMVEHTRSHPRLPQEKPAGRRETLRVGTLFLPEALPGDGAVPLFVHFHGAPWLAEVAAARLGKAACVSVQLGAGSSTYARPFADPGAFGELLHEAEAKAGRRFQPVVLTAWSAGYGAVRAILRVPEHYQRVKAVLLLDGLHAGYVGGQPGPRESSLITEDLDVFVKLARDATAGKKQLLVTHTEIFPGTFASTTETADYLLKEVGLQREPVLKWGPLRTQQLSEARQGGLCVVGYAGNAAPDHVDQLHALPELLKWVEWGK